MDCMKPVAIFGVVRALVGLGLTRSGLIADTLSHSWNSAISGNEGASVLLELQLVIPGDVDLICAQSHYCTYPPSVSYSS